MSADPAAVAAGTDAAKAAANAAAVAAGANADVNRDAAAAAAATAAATAKAAGEAAKGAVNADSTDAAAAAKAAADKAAADADTAKLAATATWPTDWRGKMAKGDEKALKFFDRYTSPEAVAEALREAQKLISSGSLKKPLDKDATPEQLKAWRKENEIPDKPEGYLENLPTDVKVEEVNKAGTEHFVKRMHELNVPPALVHEAIKWQNQWQEQQIEARVTADEVLKARTEDVLRKEWGNDYRVNINTIHSFLDTLPESVSEALLQARTPDGDPLVGTPQAMGWLASLARQMNPVPTIVSASGATMGSNQIEPRKREIEKLMGNRSSEYWRGPNADALQKEYRDIIDALAKMKRSAA